MKDHGKNSKGSFPPSFERLLRQKCIYPKTKELKNYLSRPSIGGGRAASRQTAASYSKLVYG